MGKTTLIEWCDSTVNLEIGCDGCELWKVGKEPAYYNRMCYAGKMVEQYEGHNGWPKNFTTPAIFPDRINEAVGWPDYTGKTRTEKPWLDGLPRLIFVNDLGDTFTESLPLDWIAPFIPEMARSPHQWLFLTKRASRMRDFWQVYGDVPENIWLGVSVTSSSNLARLKYLKDMRAPVRFVSFEPILGPLPDLFGYLGDPPWVNWAIVGGLSGSKQRSHPDVIADVLIQLADLEIRTFFKQWGHLSSNPDRRDPTARENGGIVKGGRMVFGKQINGMPALVSKWRSK